MARRINKTVISVLCIAFLLSMCMWVILRSANLRTQLINVQPIHTTSSDSSNLAAYHDVVQWKARVENVSDQFKPISPADQANLRRTVAAISSAFDLAGMFYWLDAGSLIGSYRHHDLIPWDGDADMVVLSTDYSAIRRALDLLSHRNCSYCEQFTGQKSIGLWRVSSTDGSQPHPQANPDICRDLRYPYVDVQAADQNETHVWLILYPEYVYRRQGVIFPLRRRPFGEGYNVQTPCDVDTYLSLYYSGYLDVCESPHYNYQNWDHPSVTRLPCRLLTDHYAFVERSRLTGQFNVTPRTKEPYGDNATVVVETLRYGNKTLGKFLWSPGVCLN